MLKCDFNKILFPKNTSGLLLLKFALKMSENEEN